MTFVIEFPFTVTDLSALRFAYSPLWELVASLRVLAAPGQHAVHLPWATEASQRLAVAPLADDPDLALARQLVPATGYIPDFLTPPPTSTMPSLDAELAAVAATPPAQVRADLVACTDDLRADRLDGNHRSGTSIGELADDPALVLPRLVAALRRYWDEVLARHWPRIRAVLEADVAFRSRRLAVGGVRDLFADLHSTVRWHGDRLLVSRHHDHDHRVDLDGRGLVLIPCAFVWPYTLVMCEGNWQPTVIYPVRGVGSLWERGRCAPDGLAAVLGRTRADLLAGLGGPASTGELADRLGVTAGAVSQHLGVLRSAGLVATERLGRTAVHSRTPVADRLVAAAIASVSSSAIT
jgi:DNA-binding transcriptional ArsR family regulator